MSEITPATLEQAFRTACLSELEALKPGNVHIFADGHGMVVQDFVRSAEAASTVIVGRDLSVGQRIMAAVNSTWDAVGCNTNLGIILLSAPLLHAALNGRQIDLRARLVETLHGLTIEDARQAYQAIVRASPAGLGKSEHHDVHAAPDVTLLEAMAEAQHRDRIAWQYAHDFNDIFAFGVQRYRETLSRWQWSAWATTSVYLGFLARFPDTHIARKFGSDMALQVQQQAQIHDDALLAMENPKLYQRTLLDFDNELKFRGINPGTSADLTVATLLAVTLENMVTGRALS